MKFKATKKEFSGYQVIKVLNCKLQTLLKYKDPIAYSAGVHGWSCDYYDINGVIISMGYSPIGKAVSYNLIDKYEKRARKIVYESQLDYQEEEKQLTTLLNEFIQEALEANKWNLKPF